MRISYTKNELILLGVIVCITLILIGAILNTIVQVEGRMPVLSDINYTSAHHFTYTEPLEIKYWYLSDIFYFGDSIFSVGDVVLTFGLLGAPLLIWFHIRKYLETKKQLKNKKRIRKRHINT